jgi:hypothetical protein
MASEQRQEPTEAAPAGVSRRRALAKLGLAAGAAYAAPTITTLDRRAYAAPTNCPPGQGGGKGPPTGKGPPGCR